MTKPFPRHFSQIAQRTEEPPISWLMRLTLDHPKLISLAAGFTDNESLPVAGAHALLREILGSGKTGRPALQYGSTQGDQKLRDLTARHLQSEDGSRNERAYAAGRLLITHGSQQLLYLVTECLCDPGDIVLVEDPTYFVYLSIAQSRGLKCRGVTLREDGIDLSQLERVLESLRRSGELKRVKMLYLVSYFQNPSGVTTSLARKAEALNLLRRYEKAAGHPLYLLEDAAYRELRFTAKDIPSALTLKGGTDRVIYAGTYSKPFATGARVGFGLLPEPLFTAALRVKGNHDFGTANLLQQLLARALDSGRYRSHLETLRARYAGKAQTMVKAIRTHFPEAVNWEVPAGGLYVWAKLPKAATSGVKSKLFKTALRRDVLYVPGGLCYADDPTRPKPDHEMRLSFGGATEPDINAGIRRLGGVLQTMM